MALILGLDEVGRGAWGGPLAVGAVVLDSARHIDGLNDSKQLSRQFREHEIREIQNGAIAIGVGWINANIIDQIGLTKALKLASRHAFAQIPAEVRDHLDQIVIDGTQNFLDAESGTVREKTITLIKADAKIASVSAASIVAKVCRDHYMRRLDQLWPDYGFAGHVGYGTALHRAAIAKFGPIAGIHRFSFAPITEFAGQRISRKTETTVKQILGKVSRSLGYDAETVAAEFLTAHGHRIISRNFKTKFYEIDIISVYHKTLYFTEVKFRENANFGGGLDAITSRKLNQMRRAVEIFMSQRADFAKGFDVQLSAIALSHNPPRVDEFIENIV